MILPWIMTPLRSKGLGLTFFLLFMGIIFFWWYGFAYYAPFFFILIVHYALNITPVKFDKPDTLWSMNLRLNRERWYSRDYSPGSYATNLSTHMGNLFSRATLFEGTLHGNLYNFFYTNRENYIKNSPVK